MSKLKMTCGYCGKKCDLDKDFCIPQDSVYVCKSCYDWQNKVSDLEAKLAEKQSKIQELNDMYEDLLVAKGTENELMQVSADCDFFAKENRKLKQQLAEKDNTITNLIEDSNASKELLKKQLNEQAGLCEEFRFQLTEKDNEIEYLNKQARKFNNEAQKYFEDAYCNDTIYQDKISFAVEQLTQAIKNIKKCNYKDFGIIYQSDAIAVIDNQIKQLKEMK